MSDKKISPDWWAKTFAGGVLGLSLAFALAGLFAWHGPGGITAPNKAQAVMWSVAWLWMPVFSLVYLFRTGAQAMLCLAAANVVAYGLWFL